MSIISKTNNISPFIALFLYIKEINNNDKINIDANINVIDIFFINLFVFLFNFQITLIKKIT